jgi:hypothetical protein
MQESGGAQVQSIKNRIVKSNLHFPFHNFDIETLSQATLSIRNGNRYRRSLRTPASLSSMRMRARAFMTNLESGELKMASATRSMASCDLVQPKAA